MKQREKQQEKETEKGRDEKMFLIQFSFALLYIAINVMMVVIVFRYEDVSKAIMIAMTTVSSTIPAMPVMNMPTMKLPSVPGPMPTPPTMPTLRQEFGTGNVVVDALSFQVVTHQHRSSRSQQPPSMSPSLKRTEGLFQVSQGDNNNEDNNDNEFFFDYNTNDDKKLVEDLRRQFYVQKMMEKQQKKNRNTPSTSSSSTRTPPKSSSAMKMKSNDGDSDIDALLYKYGTSSPIFRILPQGMKEAADRLVSKMLSSISNRPASTAAQQHKHA